MPSPVIKKSSTKTILALKHKTKEKKTKRSSKIFFDSTDDDISNTCSSLSSSLESSKKESASPQKKPSASLSWLESIDNDEDSSISSIMSTEATAIPVAKAVTRLHKRLKTTTVAQQQQQQVVLKEESDHHNPPCVGQSQPLVIDLSMEKDDLLSLGSSDDGVIDLTEIDDSPPPPNKDAQEGGDKACGNK
jgi:hypothetical protein